MYYEFSCLMNASRRVQQWAENYSCWFGEAGTVFRVDLIDDQSIL